MAAALSNVRGLPRPRVLLQGLGTPVCWRRTLGLESCSIRLSLPLHSVPCANAFSTDATSLAQWDRLIVSIDQPSRVATLSLNRPKRLNAFDRKLMSEVASAMCHLAGQKTVRAIVLKAEGKAFSSGLDLLDHTSLLMPQAPAADAGTKGTDANAAPAVTQAAPQTGARKALELHRMVTSYQATVSSLESCRVPVIAVVHGPCIGAGFDLVTAADVRICTADAWFQAAEVHIGIAPDIGLLQRLPRVMGNDSLARELVYTGRKLSAAEAQACGLVSSVHPSLEHAHTAALHMAKVIASHSPVAVQVAKVNLNYSRDHPIASGLAYNAAYAMSALQSSDVPQAAMEQLMKTKDKGEKEGEHMDPARFGDI